MVLQGGCYCVAGSCFGFADWLQGVAMVLLGGCYGVSYGVARRLLWCC